MHAVEPAEVRANAERMTVDEITKSLNNLDAGPELVVLSGGNPALLELGSLVASLQAEGRRVAVETQGSRWRAWLSKVDRLVISPKPPSSGMAGQKQMGELRAFMEHVSLPVSPALKFVVFDDEDLEWAAARHREYPDVPLFLSAGTDVGLPNDVTVDKVRERFRWLCETVAARPDLSRARVLPQLHVIAWGTAKGV